ncbi:MAG: RNA methyltransferase [Lachnospiraceae bacterium]|nr:RNA methyltransferase [Lachnospiraceae bacterium]
MITSTKNPAVAEVRELVRRARARRESGTYIVEGRRMVSEVPPERFVRGFVTEAFLERCGTAALGGLPYDTVTDAVMDAMADTVTPQGILAIVRMHDVRPEDLPGDGAPLYLVLEGISDPGNMGTLLRTAEGAGASAVVLAGDCADPYQPKAVRSSMGSLLRMPVCRMGDGAQAAALLQKKGVRCFGAALEGSVPYTEAAYTGPAALFVGSEAHGLARETVAAMDACVRIPMEGKVESLNAAVAGAVLLYEAKRQRGQQV